MSYKPQTLVRGRLTLRKLSIGLASVLIGISFFSANQTVKADIVDSTEQSAQVVQNADKPVQNKFNAQTQQNTSKELAKQTENTDIQKQPEKQGQNNNSLKQSNTVKFQDILDNKSNIKIHKTGSNYVEFSYVNKPSVIFNLFKENGKYYLLANNKKYTITSFKQLVSTINHYLLNSLSSNA